MARTFKAKSGGPITDKQAAIIGRYLYSQFPDGNFEPKEVVELASDKKSPIHQFFDWDDTSAARKYRLIQARSLVRCIVVVTPGKSQSPAFVNVRVQNSATSKKTHREYMQTEKARNIPIYWEQVKKEAYEGLLSWERRYKALDAFDPVYKAIKKVSVKFTPKNSNKKS